MKQNKKILLGMIFLILFMPSIISAVECSGQNCGANMSLNVSNGTIITPVPPSFLTGQTIYNVFASSGAGLSLFMRFIAQALPYLLIGLAIVVMVIFIIISIIKLINLFKGEGVKGGE